MSIIKNSAEIYIDKIINEGYKLEDLIIWLESTKEFYGKIKMFCYLFSAMSKNINELSFYKNTEYYNKNIFEIIKLENKNDDKNLINKNKMPIESAIIWAIRKVYLYIQFLINYSSNKDKTNEENITDAYMEIYYNYHREGSRSIFINNFKYLNSISSNIIDELIEKNKEYINKCKFLCDKITNFYLTEITLPDDLNKSYF